MRISVPFIQPVGRVVYVLLHRTGCYWCAELEGRHFAVALVAGSGWG